MPAITLMLLVGAGIGMLAAHAVGFSLVVAESTAEFPRNTEGSIVELADGRLLLGWSRFSGGTDDSDAAVIAGKTSSDGGKTWGPSFVVQENIGGRNVMSASLLRLKSGRIALFYLVKNSNSDLHLYARFSADEANTWGTPVRVTVEEGYNVVNNDRIIQTSSGRLIAPVSLTADVGTPDFVSNVVYSDDEGKTWRRSSTLLRAPLRGAMEPGVAELAPGRLLMIIRTQTGFIYRSESHDDGSTWSDAIATDIVSPESPATLKRIPGSDHLLLIWNNNPEARENFRARRAPLTAAISTDGGKTWGEPVDIESDTSRAYAYASALFAGKDVLLTYYDTVDWDKGLSLRFRKLPVDSLYGRPKP